MLSRPVRIAVISDSRNYSIADTYFTLLRNAGPKFQCCTVTFDPAHPERTTQHLEKAQVVLANVGIPGRRDYTDYMHGFLDAFAAARRKPATGIVTHDSEHTRYIIDRWLGGDARSPRDLPDGAVNIIDASRPLRYASLEKAIEALLDKAPPGPASRQYAIPFTHVRVGSFSFRMPGNTLVDT